MSARWVLLIFFFFNDTATTEIYTLSLHDALPICFRNLLKILVRSRSLRFTADTVRQSPASSLARLRWGGQDIFYRSGDRKSTRLNSSHSQISYAVFCLKKKR